MLSIRYVANLILLRSNVNQVDTSFAPVDNIVFHQKSIKIQLV